MTALDKAFHLRHEARTRLIEFALAPPPLPPLRCIAFTTQMQRAASISPVGRSVAALSIMDAIFRLSSGPSETSLGLYLSNYNSREGVSSAETTIHQHRRGNTARC